MSTQTWTDWSCSVAVTTMRDADLAPAVAAVRAVMAEVAASASRFRDDSDLARVNAAAGRFVAVSPLTVSLVELALDVAQRTGGAVTPTVGGALVALGYDDDIEVVRAREETAGCTPSRVPAASAVRVDPYFGRIGVTDGTVLDLGAIAKAYAVDEAVRRLGALVEGPALVSIGGDLAVHATPDDGWTIAVSETPDAPTELVTIDGGALATSSTQGRRWAGGHHHVVDPRTGLSVSGRFRTATVWAPSAVAANLLSTWALVDADAALGALARDVRPARLVTADGAVERLHRWPQPADGLGVAS